MYRGVASSQTEERCSLVVLPTPHEPHGHLVPVGAEVESVAGHLVAGDDSQLTWFVVTYADGDEEHREGTLLEASELASTHGLVIVPSPSGSFRWVRDPGTWKVPHRATP
jgi:hypothetical protein